LSHVQRALEVSRNGFHSTSYLHFPHGVRPGFDYENRVIGIKIEYGVEVLPVDRLVRILDEERNRMWARCSFPSLGAKQEVARLSDGERSVKAKWFGRNSACAIKLRYGLNQPLTGMRTSGGPITSHSAWHRATSSMEPL